MRVVRTLAVLAAVTGMSSGAALAAEHGLQMSVYAPANRCFALQVAGGTGSMFVAARGRTYAASAPSRARATAFYLKPTGLGTYMLYDSHARTDERRRGQGTWRAPRLRGPPPSSH